MYAVLLWWDNRNSEFVQLRQCCGACQPKSKHLHQVHLQVIKEWAGHPRPLLKIGILTFENYSYCWAGVGAPVWPIKSSQMPIKVAQNDFTKKLKILTPLQKLPKNVWDFGKLMKSCPKSNKSANLFTLVVAHLALSAENKEIFIFQTRTRLLQVSVISSSKSFGHLSWSEERYWAVCRGTGTFFRRTFFRQTFFRRTYFRPVHILIKLQFYLLV